MIFVAGGIVWNPHKGVVVVNQNNDSWSLPKGHVESGEDTLAAAIREIHEETGINPSDLTLTKEVGSYVRSQIKWRPGDEPRERTITLYLFTTTATNLAPIDPENPEARWVAPEEVAALLTHPKDGAFFTDFLLRHPLSIHHNQP